MSTDASRQPVHGIFRNVQALRAIAVTLVVLLHLGNARGIEIHYFPGQQPLFGLFGDVGVFGVDLFFVISGFIMVTTTWKNFGKPRAGLDFLVRRCLRIYPPYWLVLVPLTLVFLVAPDRFTMFHAFHTNLVASYLLLPQLTEPLLGVSWTLVFEMFFYLVFAVLLLFPRETLFKALVPWFVLEFVLYALFRDSSNAGLNFLGRPYAVEFIFGAIVALLYVRERFLPAPLLLFGAVCVFVGHLVFVTHYGGSVLERVLVIGLTSMLAVYGAVCLEARNRIAAPAWLVSIGDSSYSLYLWHIPVLTAIAQVVGRFSHHKGYAFHVAADLAMIAFVYAFGWLFYKFVEVPMTEFLKRSLLKKRIIGASSTPPVPEIGPAIP